MSAPLRLVAAAAVGYVLGTIPSADLAGRANGTDIRAAGTGNPGAMNVHHVLGRRWGAAVAVADVAKGAAAARVGARIAGPSGANLAAAAAVGGHCFPVGRTGGKGIATSIGHVLGTFPAYLPLDLAVGAATSSLPFLRQRTRTASSVASIVWVGAAFVGWRRRFANPGGVTPTAALPLAAAASSLLIALRFAREVERVEAYNDGRRLPAGLS